MCSSDLQSYVSQALNTRYSQQNELDATDTSQDYVHDLANRQPGIGINNKDFTVAGRTQRTTHTILGGGSREW